MAFVAAFLAGIGFVVIMQAIVFCVALGIYKVTGGEE